MSLMPEIKIMNACKVDWIVLYLIGINLGSHSYFCLFLSLTKHYCYTSKLVLKSANTFSLTNTW